MLSRCARKLNKRNMCFKRLVALMGFVQLVNSEGINFIRWIKLDAFTDVMPPSGYQPDVTNTRSKLECAYLCGQESVCMSFFYSGQTSVCQLHDVVVLNATVGLNKIPSSQYYIREVPYPDFTCPADDTLYRTVKLTDYTLFTYKVYKIPKVTQDVALNNCVADGAHLVRLTSSAKMDVLLQLITTCTGYSGLLTYWVDLTNSNAADFSDVNQWVSSDGVPLPAGINFWDTDQPNDYRTRHCASLESKHSYKAADRFCNVSYSYICEK